MRLADAGKKQAEIIINLGRRRHGRTRIRTAASLLNGDSRRQAFNAFDVRLLHLFEELAGISA